MRVGQGQLPAFGGFHRIARAIHGKVGNDPHGCQMLHRLMRRAIFAKADRVMGHHIDDALAHQGGQADRRAAIIGEHQKRAAIGNDAAMQRQSIHRRRHAMFADAVIDIAAGIIGCGKGFHVLRLGVVGAGQVGRAAQRIGQCRVDDIKCILRGVARGDPRRVLGQLLLVGGHRGIKAGGQFSRVAAAEFGLLDRGIEPCRPGLALIAPA